MFCGVLKGVFALYFLAVSLFSCFDHFTIANSCTHVYCNYHKVQSYRMLDLTNMRGGDGKPKYLHILQFPGVFWYFNIMKRFRVSERC